MTPHTKVRDRAGPIVVLVAALAIATLFASGEARAGDPSHRPCLAPFVDLIEFPGGCGLVTLAQANVAVAPAILYTDALWTPVVVSADVAPGGLSSWVEGYARLPDLAPGARGIYSMSLAGSHYQRRPWRAKWMQPAGRCSPFAGSNEYEVVLRR